MTWAVWRSRNCCVYGVWMTSQNAECDSTYGMTTPPAPCVCFTELKLSQSRNHAKRYGRLGIAVKRPFLFNRNGRPLIYVQTRHRWAGTDTFLQSCSRELTDKRMLHFFKPMDSGKGRRLEYDFYSESEWRIVAGIQRDNRLIVDPRTTSEPDIRSYFASLSKDTQDLLTFLVPLDGWLAAITYPSIDIKNAAQAEGSEVRRLIRNIAMAHDDAHGVEGDNFPIELDLDLCRNL